MKFREFNEQVPENYKKHMNDTFSAMYAWKYVYRTHLLRVGEMKAGWERGDEWKRECRRYRNRNQKPTTQEWYAKYTHTHTNDNSSEEKTWRVSIVLCPQQYGLIMKYFRRHQVLFLTNLYIWNGQQQQQWQQKSISLLEFLAMSIWMVSLLTRMCETCARVWEKEKEREGTICHKLFSSALSTC